MRMEKLEMPLIIGEVFYNDSETGALLNKAWKENPKTKILYLLHWPLSKNKKCSDVDIPAPVDYNNYVI